MTLDINELDLSTIDLSPRSSEANGHFVELYEDDSFLVDSVARFMSLALREGDAAVAVADRAHRELFDDALRAQGIDVDAAMEHGTFVSLDADEMLARFMEGAMPDAEKFDRILGEVIASAAAGERKVRVFGEMVAVLWTRGNVPGALRVEDLWNDLAENHHFDLFCAYPLSAFGEENLAPLRAVCHRHSHVITAGAKSA